MQKKIKIFLLVMLLIGANCFLLPASSLQAAGDKIVVYIAGDSTACDYEAIRAPRTGWGQVLGQFFTDQVTVSNQAISGRSSMSYILEGSLDKILAQIKPNDYLLIQFGHNDEKKTDPARYTEANTTFKSYLTQYIQGARNKGSIPVLLTPIHRFGFDGNGKVVNSHGDYPKAMIELAKAEQIPLIDMTEKTKILMEGLGFEKTISLFLQLKPGESPNYPSGSKDNTHLRIEGAMEVARLVVEGIKENNLPLAKYIK